MAEEDSVSTASAEPPPETEEDSASTASAEPPSVTDSCGPDEQNDLTSVEKIHTKK